MADAKPAEKRSAEQRISDLELALAQSRAGQPLGTLPNHGAGIGQEVEETWSLADQQLAQAGAHPLQEDDETDQPGPAPIPSPHK